MTIQKQTEPSGFRIPSMTDSQYQGAIAAFQARAADLETAINTGAYGDAKRALESLLNQAAAVRAATAGTRYPHELTVSVHTHLDGTLCSRMRGGSPPRKENLEWTSSNIRGGSGKS